MTNTNSLTEIQIKAVRESIMDSLRRSLSMTNLKYDPKFDQTINLIADGVINNAQVKLEKPKLEKPKKEKIIKNLKVIKNVRK